MGAVLLAEGLVLRNAEGRMLVQGVDLRVAPGECVGVVGESGAGKTLTARAALGLAPEGVRVEARRVELAGVDVLGADPRRHRELLGRHVGYVPQNTSSFLHPALKVRSQIADGYRTWQRVSAPCALQRARDLLCQVGIADPDRVLASFPGQLSGGMRQRVNIAMALMGDPDIVVADEPTAALDAITRVAVADLLIRATRERGASLLLVSHDLSLVRRRCDRVMVMRRGRCVEEGPTGQVLGAPAHPYTAALLAAVPKVGRPRGERLAEYRGEEGGE